MCDKVNLSWDLVFQVPEGPIYKNGNTSGT